jgi:hypothetical protein
VTARRRSRTDATNTTRQSHGRAGADNYVSTY